MPEADERRRTGGWILQRARAGGGMLLLAYAGASAWISCGTLAVLNPSTTRVGALPPAWLLVVLVVGAAAAGWWTRARASTLAPLALTAVLWLPWLPVPVPAAFLIWSGPAALFVWVAAIGGVVAGSAPASLPSSITPWLTHPRRAPLVLLVAGLVSALAAARVLAAYLPSGDEPHYLVITQSLLLDGDLRIENNHLRRDYAPYVNDLPRPDFLRRGIDGQIYSVHAPGLPALVAPAFAVGGYAAVVIFLAFVAACGGALAWHAAWLVTGSAPAAWVGWASVFFSTPVFFHTFTIYPDGAGAVLAMAAVWLLVRLDVDDATPRGLLVAIGSALALLPWLHSRFSVVAGGLGLALLIRLLGGSDRWRNAIAFAAVPVLSAVAWFGFFRIIYGTFSPAAPYGNVVQNRLATLRPGLPGIFFDQQFGLITNAPIFAVAVMGLIVLARHRRRLVAELTLVAVPYVLAVASYVMWWAGLSAPARFLMILLLPAAIPVAWLFQRSGRWARAAIGAAALFGAVSLGQRALVDTGALYNDRSGYDALLDRLSPHVNLPLAFPSFHRDVPPAALADAAAWAVALTVALIALRALLRRPDLSRGVAWMLTSVLMTATVMLASTYVWSRHGANRVITPASSQLGFLQGWRPARQPLEVQLAPLVDLRGTDVLSRFELQASNRGPGAGANPPLLELPLVPAGEYEIVVTASGAAALAGTLEVSVGRSTQTIERFDLAGLASGAAGLTLTLPVLAQSIALGGDAAARRAVSHVSLRPLSVRPPARRVADTYATHAARYGSARVFFLDEQPFMETPGFWTAGASSTTIVVDTDAGSRRSLVLRAGAVPTKALLRAGAWHAEYDLEAGEARTVPLPEPSAAHALSIRTTASFTPADFDPASTDVRELGVWVEFPR